MKTGVELIATERQRQISKEGWTAEHDDNEHPRFSLSAAAAGYLLKTLEMDGCFGDPISRHVVAAALNVVWPEDWEFKPKNEMRNLVRAGALIAAEIDRLQRKGKSK